MLDVHISISHTFFTFVNMYILYRDDYDHIYNYINKLKENISLYIEFHKPVLRILQILSHNLELRLQNSPPYLDHS